MKTIQKSVFGIPGKKLKNGCGVLFLFLGILSFFVCLLQAFGQDIWFDEVFSVNFIQHSYREIAALTGKDVHPPLYYWYLKLFHDIGKVLVPAASSIVLCKLASMLPFVGIFVYTLTAIRKNFGLHVAGLFWFLVMTMPQISNYTVEIRMYSLALFFITAAFVHSCELIRAFSAQGVSEAERTAEPGAAAGTEETAEPGVAAGTEEAAEPGAAGSEVTSGAVLASGSVTGENGLIKWWKKNKHWLLFWVYGILTAYTQYYACVAVIAIYIALFVFFVVKAHKGKTEKTSCKKTHIYKEQLKEQEAILTKAPVKGWKAEHTTEQETGRIAGKCIGKVLLCAGLSVLAYLPWLPFFFFAGTDGKQQLLDSAAHLEKYFRMHEIYFPAGFLCGKEELRAGLCDDFALWCSLPVFLPYEKKGCKGTLLSAYRIMDCGIYHTDWICMLDSESSNLRIPVSHPLPWGYVACGSSCAVGFYREKLGHSVIRAVSSFRIFEYAGLLWRRE